jgi:hypothetical protein
MDLGRVLASGAAASQHTPDLNQSSEHSSRLWAPSRV